MIIEIMLILVYGYCLWRCYFLSYDVGRAFGCGYNYSFHEKMWKKNKKHLSTLTVIFLVLTVACLLFFLEADRGYLYYLFPVGAAFLYAIICLGRLGQGKNHKTKGIWPRHKRGT